MKYMGIPAAMWMLFERSFRKQLSLVMALSPAEAETTTRAAKKRYRQIISELPVFEKQDQFCINIVSCAMLAAFVLSMPRRPNVEELTDYYAQAMMTPAMKWFCRRSGRRKFTPEELKVLRATEKLRAGDRNPYSWNMELYPYPDGSGYEARFTQCGICTLMKKLGLYDLTPALCHLDYTMSEASGASRFIRRQTIASGGAWCDCGYKKRD